MLYPQEIMLCPQEMGVCVRRISFCPLLSPAKGLAAHNFSYPTAHRTSCIKNKFCTRTGNLKELLTNRCDSISTLQYSNSRNQIFVKPHDTHYLLPTARSPITQKDPPYRRTHPEHMTIDHGNFWLYHDVLHVIQGAFLTPPPPLKSLSTKKIEYPDCPPLKSLSVSW